MKGPLLKAERELLARAWWRISWRMVRRSDDLRFPFVLPPAAFAHLMKGIQLAQRVWRDRWQQHRPLSELSRDRRWGQVTAGSAYPLATLAARESEIREGQR